MSGYDVGDFVRITATFTDSDGIEADPTTVKCMYRHEYETATTLTYGIDAALVKSGTGVYYVDLSLTKPGHWFYRWEGTGAIQAADESVLTTNTTVFYT